MTEAEHKRLKLFIDIAVKNKTKQFNGWFTLYKEQADKLGVHTFQSIDTLTHKSNLFKFDFKSIQKVNLWVKLPSENQARYF